MKGRWGGTSSGRASHTRLRQRSRSPTPPPDSAGRRRAALASPSAATRSSNFPFSRAAARGDQFKTKGTALSETPREASVRSHASHVTDDKIRDNSTPPPSRFSLLVPIECTHRVRERRARAAAKADVLRRRKQRLRGAPSWCSISRCRGWRRQGRRGRLRRRRQREPQR